MLLLTDEQRSALTAAGGAGVELEDARTGRRYVLKPIDAPPPAGEDAAGEAGDVDPAVTYPLIAEALAEVWDDPRLDAYANVPAMDDANP